MAIRSVPPYCGRAAGAAAISRALTHASETDLIGVIPFGVRRANHGDRRVAGRAGPERREPALQQPRGRGAAGAVASVKDAERVAAALGVKADQRVRQAAALVDKRHFVTAARGARRVDLCGRGPGFTGEAGHGRGRCPNTDQRRQLRRQLTLLRPARASSEPPYEVD